MEIISRADAIAAGLKHYFTGEPCKRGHTDVRRVANHACLSCHRENQRRLIDTNPEFKERQRVAAANWKKKPHARELAREYNKNSYKKRDRDKERIRLRELQRRMRASSVQHRLKQSISRRISFHINKGGLSTSKLLEKQCGYTVADLMQHLERQFLPGMTWDNYGRSGWHVDHIVPVDDFDLTTPAEFSACWSLGNLRPTWWNENVSKSNKRLFLL